MIISELSARAGASARSIRYYEQLGLIESERAGNGYRHYDEGSVEVVRTIRAMFELGFSREDVREVLPCATGDHDAVDRDRLLGTVTGVRDDLAQRIEDLTRTKAALDRFLVDPASVSASDPDLRPVRGAGPLGVRSSSVRLRDEGGRPDVALVADPRPTGDVSRSARS